jgi:hypothetical protein
MEGHCSLDIQAAAVFYDVFQIQPIFKIFQYKYVDPACKDLPCLRIA